MNNYEKLFTDELINWMVDNSGFKQSQFQMSIYCKYTPHGSKLVVLSYVDEYSYWYKFEELLKWFVDTLEIDYM